MTHPSKRKGDEEWRTIPGFPAYEISESGIVRRLAKSRTRNVGHFPAGVMGHGYHKYKLIAADGTKQTVPSHRLVCLAFFGPPPSQKHQVAHWDGNRVNNHVSNLRWATSKENHEDRIRHGRSGRGSDNGRSKLTETQAVEIRHSFRDEYGATAKLARQYGVSWTVISDIVQRRKWTHV